MQVFQWRTGQLELACRLKADGAIFSAHGDDLAAFLDRFPAELPQVHQQIVDTAWLVIGRGVKVVAFINELLMLSTDAPAIFGFLAADHRREQLVAALDQRIVGQ